jgi:hypothetical protein
MWYIVAEFVLIAIRGACLPINIVLLFSDRFRVVHVNEDSFNLNHINANRSNLYICKLQLVYVFIAYIQITVTISTTDNTIFI